MAIHEPRVRDQAAERLSGVTVARPGTPPARLAPADEHLVEERRRRLPKRPSRRDVVTSGVLAGGFLTVAVALAAFVPWNRPAPLAVVAALVAVYALLSRVDFEVGSGSAVPVQLVLVPMLFVLPVPLVPLLVASGYVLGALPSYVSGRVHPARALVLVSSSWYAIGPAVVLSLFPSDAPAWRHAPVYLAALAAQFALDAVSSSLRERLVFGHSPRMLLASFAWLWAVDSFLAPIGLVAALSGPAAVLLVLPLAGLLAVIAYDRRARIDRTVAVGQAYRGAVDEAHRDELSGLGNRRKLLSDLERVCAESADEHVLVVCDLNGFKHYNDTFGHPAGDALLKRLAGKLSAAVEPAAGTAYRLGGDEFCVLAAPPADRVQNLIEATVDALSEQGEGFSISTCLGAAFIPSEADEGTAALTIADRRLYSKKHARNVSRGQPHLVLLEALFERDPDLRTHVDGVASLSTMVARRLGVQGEQLEELIIAAQLHDVGKIAIPEAVLNKPGRLTGEEHALIRQHTRIGQRILGAVPALAAVGVIVRATHERWDGNGYVDGLAGEAIPLSARIIAVCDAFDAMTSTRPYCGALATDAAIEELRRCAGSQFDPEIVRAFCEILPVERSAAVLAA